MDQRTSAIDEDLKGITRTRIAIAEKLALLERQLTHRVEDVTMTSSGMLNKVTDNIGNFVDKTKAVIDQGHRFDRHPWLMFGGALCAGYAIGLIEQGSRPQRRGVYPYYPPGVRGSRVMPPPAQRKTQAGEADGVYDYYPHESPSAQRGTKSAGSSLWSSLSREFGQDTEEAKDVILQVGRSLLVELARRAMPEVARTLGVNLSALMTKEGRSSQPEATSQKAAHAEPRRTEDARQPAREM